MNSRVSYRTWRVVDILAVLGAYAGVMLLLYVAVAVMAGIDALNTLQSTPWFVLLEAFVECSVFVGAPIFIVRRIYQAELGDIGLGSQVSRGAIVAGFVVGTFLWVAMSLSGELMESILGYETTHPDLARLKGSSGSLEYLFLSIPMLVLAPVSEEIFSRGFVYSILKERFGVYVALAGSSVLFAAFHLSLVYLLPTLVAAIGLGMLREKYKSVAPSILAHATVNLLSIIPKPIAFSWP